MPDFFVVKKTPSLFGRAVANPTEARTMAQEAIPWQDARAWLSRTGVLPPSHPALQPGATLPEFACLLQDGEVLLLILKRFKPELTLRIHAKPKMPVRSQMSCAVGLRPTPVFFLYNTDIGRCFSPCFFPRQKHTHNSHPNKPISSCATRTSTSSWRHVWRLACNPPTSFSPITCADG